MKGLERWYERCPERLDAELRALADAGFPVEIDEAARQHGELRLIVKCLVGEELHGFVVVFPVDYPFFAFQVFAPSLTLGRHQDPYTKALCFKARIETEWRSDDTVARYLLERLPDILEANRRDASFEGEAQEGAPVTGYFPFAPDSEVLLGDVVVPADVPYGTLMMGLEEGFLPDHFLRAAVFEVLTLKGTKLAEIDAGVRRAFPNRFKARWVRLPTRPASTDPRVVLAELIQHWPALAHLEVNGGAPDVIGVVFQDEARYREMHDLWLFLVRRKDRALARRSKSKRLPPGDQVTLYWARADRVGQSDLQVRVPRLVPLSAKKAAVFGLGALGSMLAWQLARAGISRLALVDHDHVSSGTLPRWLLGLIAAGRHKAGILSGYIERNYPFVKAEPFGLRLGQTGANAESPKHMQKALDGADIIVDCTAEFTVHHYLSTIAREEGIPYLWASGTQGGWGGVVGRVVPGTTSGCWGCFYRHLTDGTFPSPAQEDAPDVQQVGCFSPTFRGAGFDLDLVSIMGARLAVGTLCRGNADMYGDFEWDVGIVDLWRAGRPIAPHWKTFPLTRHERCDAHG